MKRLTIMAAVVLIGATYLAGYWPQHRRAVNAETQRDTAQQSLAGAERKLGLSELLGQILRLSDAVDARNYGEAATLASAYFDRVRQEASRDDGPEVKLPLEEILQTRDRVTADLARSDPSVSSVIRGQELTLRTALGYAIPPTPP